MEVPARSYTLDSFYSWLDDSASDFARRIKLVVLLSSSHSWNESSHLPTLEDLLRRQGFALRAMGEIKEISTTYKDPETDREIEVKFYCHLEKETQILRCFTSAKKKDIAKTIIPLTERPGLHRLWIDPRTFREIERRILQRPGAKVTQFSAARRSSLSPDARIRPETPRRVSYRGADAQETLEETAYQYGVIPELISFSIPGIGSLQISKNGAFSFSGEEMSFLDEISEIAINHVLSTKRIIDSSRIEPLQMKTARKELELFHLRPWTIEFGRTIGAEEVEDLFQELESTKFVVYNSVIMKGSLHAECTILDEVKQTVFTITTDDQRISLSPRYQSSFESFFRFYQTVVEKFDSGAVCMEAAAF